MRRNERARGRGAIRRERKGAGRAGEGGPPGAPSLVRKGRVYNFLELVTVSDWIELKLESRQSLAPGPSPPPVPAKG